MSIYLLFPDSTVVRGVSYRDAEDTLRAAQWQTYATRRAFRREMRARARLWSGRKVKAYPMSSRAFLRSLAAAGMLRIETRGDAIED